MTTPESFTSADSAVPATLDASAINVILATDCGSTTTKAILIEKVDLSALKANMFTKAWLESKSR